MKNFNGFTSWNEWNVNLWFANDENLYNIAREIIGYPTTMTEKISALKFKLQFWNITQTPDGAKFNNKALKSVLENLS